MTAQRLVVLLATMTITYSMTHHRTIFTVRKDSVFVVEQNKKRENIPLFFLFCR